MHAVQQEDALAESCNGLFHRIPVERLPTACAFEAFHHAHLVTFGLQATDEPGTGVRQSAVVEVDRILRGEDDAKSKGARLFEQREQQYLGRRIRDRRHVAEQFIDVENGAQRSGTRLRTHPRQNVGEQQRHEEHAFRVTEVCDRNDRTFRFTTRIVQQICRVERFTLEPVLEPRRGKQIVEFHRQLHSILRWKDRIEWHDADCCERWRLNAPDQPCQVEILAFVPYTGEQVCEENMFATGDWIGVDTEQREYAGRRGVNTFAQRLAVFAQCRRRRNECTQQRDRSAGGTSRRVDGDVCGVSEALDAITVFPPTSQAIAPRLRLLRGEFVGRNAGVRRLLRIYPRTKVRRSKLRKAQCEISQIALRVDCNDRDAIHQRFLDQVDPEPRLAAAGHADDDGVRRQIFRIVQHEIVAARSRGEIVAFAEVERAQLFVVRHVPFVVRLRGERGVSVQAALDGRARAAGRHVDVHCRCPMAAPDVRRRRPPCWCARHRPLRNRWS